MVPIFAAVAVLILITLGIVFFMHRPRAGGSGRSRGRGKSRDAQLREATKRLNGNPKDPEGLLMAGDIYYQEGQWDAAYRTYEALLEIITENPSHGLDTYTVNLRYALSALKLNLLEQAFKGLSTAWTIKNDSFEVNYNLGYIEFQRKNYEQAIKLLQQARIQDPEHPGTLRVLGHAFFKLKKFKEAMSYIRKAMDLAPDDKESLYTLAECYHEANQIEQALKIYRHLRPDPQMGADACLQSGSINMESHQMQQAIEDFEIGLRHKNIKPDVEIDMKYRLATCYLRQNDIAKALGQLYDIQAINANYRDVANLIGKYAELNANKNLQIYTMAPSADFVALCRKIVMSYYPRAKVKITSISVNKNEWADILAEVDTPKWSDLVMFRFIRTQGAIGEMIVREFHTHLKEVKAGKGICITVGSYTEEARRYTEARLIDLIEKDKLSAMLNSVDAKLATQTAAAKRR
ncbi:MAG: tetratricopeptide repeat protein [Spirochaetaceae bacterium]|jgi:tetratricopeptide (TPR) repeat protein|nr:tetratricopeptide repeat protein [Spirochaetaceae bacterium]